MDNTLNCAECGKESADDICAYCLCCSDCEAKDCCSQVGWQIEATSAQVQP